MPLRKVEQKGLLFRNYELDSRSINEEARTVELSFSSETDEIQEWRGIVILDHDPKSIRLDRINKAGPLLFMHNMSWHFGCSGQFLRRLTFCRNPIMCLKCTVRILGIPVRLRRIVPLRSR